MYTPGPWFAFCEGKTVAVHKGDVRRNPHASAIVHWSGFDASNTPVFKQKANARLIAAAPDLLAALEALVARCRQSGLHQLGPGEPFPIKEAEDAIKAAKE